MEVEEKEQDECTRQKQSEATQWLNQQIRQSGLQLKERTARFIEANRLELFFTAKHLQFVQAKFLRILVLGKKLNFVPRFDEGTIENFFLLSERAMEAITTDWERRISYKSIADCSFAIITYRVKENEDDVTLLDVLVLKEETGEVLYIDRVKKTITLECIEQNIARADLLCTKTEEALVAFIRENELQEHYVDPLILEKKQARAIQWLRYCFRDAQMIVSFDFTEPYLLRQLLTCERSESFTILQNATAHPWVSQGADDDPFLKREVSLVCREVRKNEPTLFEQVTHNADIFSNLLHYPELREKGGCKSTVLIDLFVLSYEGHIKSLGLADKPAYAEIQRKVIANRHLRNRLAKTQRGQSFEEQAREERLILRDIKTIVDAYVLNLQQSATTGQTEVIIDVHMQYSIRLHISSLVKRHTGLLGAWHTVKETLDDMIRKACGVVQLKGRDLFPEPLTMNEEVIPLDDFDLITPLSSPLVREILSANDNRLKLEHHREHQLDVALFSIKHGRHTLSSAVMPCVPNTNYFINNGIIINNITYSLEQPQPQPQSESSPTRTRANKRKIVEDVTLIERYKRVRRMNDVRQDDENSTVFREKRVAVKEPDFSTTQTCPVCEKMKGLKAFTRTERRRKDKERNSVTHYHYVSTLCNACIKQSDLLKKTAILVM